MRINVIELKTLTGYRPQFWLVILKLFPASFPQLVIENLKQVDRFERAYNNAEK